MKDEDEKLQDLQAIYEAPVGGAQHKADVSANGLYWINFTIHELHQQRGKNLQRSIKDIRLRI